MGVRDRVRLGVTACRAGPRRDVAAAWLRGEGFEAESLDGGNLAWKWAGLPITGGIVHPKPELSHNEMQALHNEFLEIALAVQERFGADGDPSEEDIRAFLKERMIKEGKTPEEADATLAAVTPPTAIPDEMGGD